MQSWSFPLWGVSLTSCVLAPQQKAHVTGSRTQGARQAHGPAHEACKLLIEAWPLCIVPGPMTQRQQLACLKSLRVFGNVRFCVDCCSSSGASKPRTLCCALSAWLQHCIGFERSSAAHPFPGNLLFLLSTFAEHKNFLQLKFCIIGKIPAMLYQCYDHSFIQFFMQITHSL